MAKLTEAQKSKRAEAAAANGHAPAEPEQPPFFRVRGDVLESTLNYLATQPYANVAQLIEVLRRSEPV